MGVYNFRNCCEYLTDEDNYFGIEYIPVEPFISGITYKIVTNNLTLCGVFIETQIPGGSTIYNDVNEVLYYGSNCSDCLINNPCIQPTPTPIPQQPQPANECSVITIFPMFVECVTVNPSTPTSTDGEMSVSITGGTPPYTIIWSNGNISPAIQNLTVGQYTATVIDYYGDFSATTTCTLTSEYDCTFSATVENFVIEPSPTQTPTQTPTPTLTKTPTPTPNISPTPTPTPTPTKPSCSEWYWETITNGSNIFYINCLGQNITFFANFPGSGEICVLGGTTPTYQTPGSNVLANSNLPCLLPSPTPTPTKTVTPTKTPTPTVTPSTFVGECICNRYEFRNPDYLTKTPTIYYRYCLGPTYPVETYSFTGYYLSLCACQGSVTAPDYVQVINLGSSNCDTE